MKKNFFKQLACVLSLAMVVTTVAPATTPVEAAKKMALNKTAATLYVNEKGFNFDVLNATKGATQTWTVSNKKVATVGTKTGFVTPKSNGKVTIKCTVAKKGTTPVVLKATVTVRTKPTSNKISNLPKSIEVGETFDLDNTIAPSATSNKNVKWYVDDSTVATIGVKDGKLTGVKAGKVKVAVVADMNKGIKDTAYIDVVAATPKAKQLGAKTIQVNLNDKLTKDITVMKGSTKIELDSTEPVSLSNDGKTAIVKAASNLITGDYTVEVKDVATKAEFKAETSKNTKIVVTSDKLVLNKDLGAATEAYASYEVQNQWGEDVSATASLTGTSSAGRIDSISRGKITVAITNGAINSIGSTSTLVLVEPTTSLSTTATLTLSSKALAAEITAEADVYNENGKKFAANSDLDKDDYYVILDVADQYGRAIVDAKTADDSGIIKNVTDQTKCNVEAKFTNITVKGVKKLALKIVKGASDKLMAGETSIVFVPLGSAKQYTHKLVVAEGDKVDTITLSTPEYAVEGEDIIVPYVAIDMYGKETTDVDVLKKMTVTSASKAFFRKNYTTGKAELVVTGAPKGTLALSIYTENYKYANIIINVLEKTTPVAVVGIDKDATFGTVVGTAIDVRMKDFKASDSYSRTKSATDVLGDGYALAFLNTDLTAAKATLTGTGTEVKGDYTVINKSSNDDGKAGKLNFTETGKKVLTVYIYNKATSKVIAGSEYEVNFTVNALNQKYSSYEIDTPDTIFAATSGSLASHANDFKVKGVDAKGNKTLLSEGTQYTIVGLDSNLTFTGGKISANNAMFTKNDKDDDTIDKTVTVAISNADDNSFLSKTIKVCEKNPELTTFSFDADKDDVDKAGDSFIVKIAAGTKVNVSTLRGLMKMKDQYDKDFAVSNIIMALTGYSGTIENNNGNANTAFTVEKDKEVKVILQVPGGKSVTATIVGK